MPGSVNRAQGNLRISVKGDHIAVADYPINADTFFEPFRGELMGQYIYPAAELCAQSFDSADMIWVQMSQNDCADGSARVHQIVNTGRECLLLVLIRRAGIYDQQLAARVDEVTVGMRRRWLCRCAQRKTDEARPKLDSTHGSTVGLRQ